MDFGGFPRRRPCVSLSAALVLAIAIHVDWHLARHHGRLSAGVTHHWLTALPIFALAGWWVARRWPRHILPVSVGTLALAALIGQGLEPLGEYVFYGWPLHEGFGPQRVGAFAAFFGAGIAAFGVTAVWQAHRQSPPGASGPNVP